MATSFERSWLVISDVAAFLIGGAGVVSQMPFLKHGPIDPVAVALFGPLIGVPYLRARKASK